MSPGGLPQKLQNCNQFTIDILNFLCYNLITVKKGENYYEKFLF